jgi:trk system potassium uptake protein TrkA
MLSENKFAVIGMGRFGSAVARTLSKRGAEVLAIDANEERIEAIKDEVAYAVTLDATDKRALMAQNILDMDAVVVSIGEDFESLVLCTVILKEMKVKRIIARASGSHQRLLMEKLGIEEILSPEDEFGTAVAEKLLNPNIVSYLQMPDDYEIAELKTPPGISNRTLKEIDLPNKYRLNLITLKREFEIEKQGEIIKEKHIIGVPNASTILYESDTIVVFGRAVDIQRFLDINQF